MELSAINKLVILKIVWGTESKGASIDNANGLIDNRAAFKSGRVKWV